MERLTKYIPWLHELLFSAYLALLIVTEEVAKQSSAFLGVDWLGYPLFRWVYPFVAYLLGRPGFDPGLEHTTIALWWLLALIILVCLRVLGRIGLARRCLRHAAGFVIVAGFPLAARTWIVTWRVDGWLMSLDVDWWLWLEVFLVLAYVGLFLYRSWPKSAALNILVLVLHFGLWCWVSWGPITAITVEPWSVYLLLGLCTALVWGLYVRLPARPHLPAKSP